MFTKKGPTFTLAAVIYLIVGIIMTTNGSSDGWVFIILSLALFILSRTTEGVEMTSDTKDD